MSKVLKLRFSCDPGHGWIAIKTAKLVELGIANQISPFSYQKGGTSYLEEDGDASVLIRTLKERAIPYEVIESHSNNRSPIRSYPSYPSAQYGYQRA